MPATAIPSRYRPVYRADGTLHTDHFASLVVPMFEQVRGAASDAEFQTLLDKITAALNRAANVRFPLDRPGTDYRRFETIYNYALMVVMATAWWMERNKMGLEALERALGTCVPAQGLARLKHESEVWRDVLAFFTGAADGGLRQVSDSHWQPVTSVPANNPPATSGAGKPVTNSAERCKSERFLTPHKNKKAGPLAKGWVLVETIRNGLADGSLPLNAKGAPVQVDREGRTFLQVPEVFEWCQQRMASAVPARTLANQFSRLGICTRTRGGKDLLRGGRRSQKRYQQGFVVEEAQIFWDGPPPADDFYILHLTAHSFGGEVAKV